MDLNGSDLDPKDLPRTRHRVVSTQSTLSFLKMFRLKTKNLQIRGQTSEIIPRGVAAETRPRPRSSNAPQSSSVPVDAVPVTTEPP